MGKGKFPFNKIKGIKSAIKRDDADEKADKKLGIKEGSKRDLKLDKAVKIDKIQYGKGKKGNGDKD